MTPEQIRSRYLSELRSLWRTIRRLECLYPKFPNAPADNWRAAVLFVADRIKRMSDTELSLMGGSHIALRNIVAQQIGIEQYDGQGGSTYGNPVLDISWE
jgi:hypothetical protein